MIHSHIFRAIILIFISLATSAHAEECSSLLKRVGAALSWDLISESCFCGKSLNMFTIDRDKELPIKAVCDGRVNLYQYGPRMEATYIQSGARKVTGDIKIYDNNVSGIFIWLLHNNENIKFANQSVIYKKLNPPIKSFEEIYQKELCVTAKATLIINELVTINGESDSSGPWITNFTPVTIGKYVSCKNDTSPL